MADAGDNGLSASLEDYLEAIFQIIREKQAARAKDIGQRLQVGRSAVTGALHALARRELINYAPYDVITLTDKGRSAAQDVVRRHEALRDFFVKVLAVSHADADAAACRMEHAISEEILDRFLEFGAFVDRCPHGRAKWVKGIGYHCGNDHMRAETCERCAVAAQENVSGRRAGRKTGSPPRRKIFRRK